MKLRELFTRIRYQRLGTTTVHRNVSFDSKHGGETSGIRQGQGQRYIPGDRRYRLQVPPTSGYQVLKGESIVYSRICINEDRASHRTLPALKSTSRDCSFSHAEAPRFLSQLSTKADSTPRRSGFSNCQISANLGISKSTGDNHAARILRKLGLRSRAQIASRATRSRATRSRLLTICNKGDPHPYRRRRICGPH